MSLGMELMPLEHKLCTFDCVYCECGFNQTVASRKGGGDVSNHKSECNQIELSEGELNQAVASHAGGEVKLPTREQVRVALETKLQALDREGVRIDVITFSGNGEPTLHPEFKGIIEDTCALRNHYAPQAKVSVLSNSTQLGRADVVEALRLCDNRILKLDSAIDQTMRLIDAPVNTELTAAHIEELIRESFGKEAKENEAGEAGFADFILQTCFLRGTVGVRQDGTVGRGEELNDSTYGTARIDNTTPEELEAWYAAVDRLRPREIMIYVIDRATPVHTLEKVSREEMERIAAPLREKGYKVVVCA